MQRTLRKTERGARRSAGALVFIPTDTLPASIAHWGASLIAFGGFVTLFAGGFVIAAIQEE